jgi:transcriptional regulator with XRE-family HTH domain
MSGVLSHTCMRLHQYIKSLRHRIGISQEALGSQGFVSTPGLIKVEAGLRSASEKLICNLAGYAAGELEPINKKARTELAGQLEVEMLALKYMHDPSPFVRALALGYVRSLPRADILLAEEKQEKPTRGRARVKL